MQRLNILESVIIYLTWDHTWITWGKRGYIQNWFRENLWSSKMFFYFKHYKWKVSFLNG